MTSAAAAFALSALVLLACSAFVWKRRTASLNETRRCLQVAADRAARAETMARAERAIVETMPDPLIVLDRSLAVLRANPAALRDFGPDAGAIIRHPSLRAVAERCLDTGAPQSADFMLPVPVRREIRASLARLDGPDPKLVVVLADRTDERAINRMRADFIANAGHELRTPLAAVIGLIETLQGPARDDPAARQRFLDMMAGQARRMERLIADLLSLSRIEMTEHERPTGTADLGAVAHAAADMLADRIAAQAAQLDIAIASDVPAVQGDSGQLEQVVQNLLDNALKYGGPGVRIRLSVARARDGVMLKVADSGSGVSPAHLPRLTERFYRAPRPGSGDPGGTGLGLAIVKHIVGRHRGRLSIESAEGAGFSVEVWLPC